MTDVGPLFPPGADAAGPDAPGVVPGPAKRGPGRPRKDTGPKAPRSPGRPSTDDKLQAKVAELYASAALLVMMADPALAGQIMTNADDLAGSWVKLAAEYPSVRKLLDRLTMTSAVGAFLAVHFRVFGPTLMEKVGGLVTGAGTPGATPGEPSADATVLPGPWMDPTP